jgi:ribonuclease D
VTQQEALQEIAQCLEDTRVKRIALDIETTGGLQPWNGTVRTIQIAVEDPEPKQWVVDVWATDPASLFKALQDPDKEIITCNGRYEQTHLYYRYGINLTNMYDLRIAGDEITRTQNKARRKNKTPLIKNSYRALMRRYTGKQISKTEQASDWDNPNLSSSQIRYAAMDVAGCLDVRRWIGQDVEKNNHTDAVKEKCEALYEKSIDSIEKWSTNNSVELQRLLRAFNCSNSIQELQQFRSLQGQLSIPYYHQETIDKAYTNRWAELATANPERI